MHCKIYFNVIGHCIYIDNLGQNAYDHLTQMGNNRNVRLKLFKNCLRNIILGDSCSYF